MMLSYCGRELDPFQFMASLIVRESNSRSFNLSSVPFNTELLTTKNEIMQTSLTLPLPFHYSLTSSK